MIKINYFLSKFLKAKMEPIAEISGEQLRSPVVLLELWSKDVVPLIPEVLFNS